MTIADILFYKYPEQMKNGQIIVKDDSDGNGPYIYKWEMGNIIKPTDEEILSWQSEVTLTQFQKNVTQLISEYIENVAKEKDYDSALSCVSYSTSTNTIWQAEATAFISWRDSVWEFCIEQYALIETGEISQPTEQEVIDALPQITWPSN